MFGSDDFLYSEEHRHECEVRFVIKHDDNWIKNYLEGIKETRKPAAHQKLRNDVVKAWKEKQASKKVVTN